jgi:VanZ family protein
MTISATPKSSVASLALFALLALLLAFALTAGLDALVGGRPLSVGAALLWCAVSYLGLLARAPAALATGAVVTVGLLVARLSWTSLLGGALLGIGAGAAGHGLRCGDALVDRLRWLVWPQVALVAAITELAYLRQLPGNLLAWPHADKVLHFVLFGAVVFWLELWLRHRVLRIGAVRLSLAIAVAAPIAATEECLQRFSSARSADLRDLICDLAGMVVAVWLARRLGGHLSRRRPAPAFARSG